MMEKECIVTEVRKKFYRTEDITNNQSGFTEETLKTREKALSKFIESVIYYLIDFLDLVDDDCITFESVRGLRGRLACSLGLNGKYTETICDFILLCLETVRREEDGLNYFIDSAVPLKLHGDSESRQNNLASNMEIPNLCSYNKV